MLKAKKKIRRLLNPALKSLPIKKLTFFYFLATLRCSYVTCFFFQAEKANKDKAHRSGSEAELCQECPLHCVRFAGWPYGTSGEILL
jgi:hypothetical protein